MKKEKQLDLSIRIDWSWLLLVGVLIIVLLVISSLKDSSGDSLSEDGNSSEIIEIDGKKYRLERVEE